MSEADQGSVNISASFKSRHGTIAPVLLAAFGKTSSTIEGNLRLSILVEPSDI